MRIFEIIILLICTVLPFVLSNKKYGFNKKILLPILVGVFFLHLFIEGLRGQMFLAYLVLLILAWCVFKEFRFFKGGWFRKITTGVVFIVLLFLGWVLPYILPVFSLPVPNGNYAVGSHYLHLQTNQDEILTSKKGDKRALMIKVWYPAVLNDEETEPYLNEGDRVGFASKYGLPNSALNYLNLIQTHTYSSPEVAKGKFPVLIFSPGIYSTASGYYALLEEIASQGYIVLNVNHTYESTGSLFPDGTIKLFDFEYDRIHNNQEMGEMAWFGNQAYFEAKTEEEQFAGIEDLIRNYVAAEITLRWSKDISVVIDELENWNSSSILASHINTAQIGVFGHSQGGAAAGQILLDDVRVKAAINVDGVQWGPMIDTILTKPMAHISADWPETHPDFNKHIYKNRSTSDFYNVKIVGTGHSNFMDIPSMIRIPIINEAGAINPKKGYGISSTFILRFFDKYLLEKSSNIMELGQEYPELVIDFTQALKK